MDANMKDSKKVTLWTRQDIRSLDELRNNGVIRIERKHLEEKFEEIADYIIKLYKWFTSAASKMVPRSEEVEFIIYTIN